MKKIVIVIVAIVLVLAIIAGVVLLALLKDDSSDKGKDKEDIDSAEEYNYVDILKTDSLDELKKYVDDHYLYLQTSDSDTLYSMGNLRMEGQDVTLYFQTDENGDFVRVDGFYEVTLKEQTAEAVRNKWNDFCDAASDHFGLLFGVDYSVYAKEGYVITSRENDVCELVLNDGAVLGMGVKEEDLTYWNATACMKEDCIMRFEFFHSYDKEMYSNAVVENDFSSTSETANGESENAE